MEMPSFMYEEHKRIYYQIAEKEKQEQLATATITTETLTKLNISIDNLPLKCQQLLQKATEYQQTLDIEKLDPIAILLRNSRDISTSLEDEYEVLQLKQKNEKLQVKIDRNNKFLNDLRNELTSSKESLMARSPNPESIQEMIRQMRQKVFAYEESCELATNKFTKLSVPEAYYPKALAGLAESLASLKAEASVLQQRADDITLAREARDLLNAARR